MDINILTVILVLYISGIITTLLFLPLSIKFAEKNDIIDIPKDSRRIHKIPTPRTGGIAIFCSVNVVLSIGLFVGLFEKSSIDFASGYAILNFYPQKILLGGVSDVIGVMIGGFVIFLIGLIDDIIELSPIKKLLGQIVAASLAFFFGVRVSFLTYFFTDSLSVVVSYVLTIIWIIAIINAINLIDGMDGLAAGVVSIASISIAYVAYIFGQYIAVFPMVIISGATLGFLPYNFYPAKTFMGDCGSQYLGYLLAAFSILGTVKGATVVSVILPVIVLFVPITDTALAIIRRVLKKQSIVSADKEHIHHKLLRAGLGQRRSVLLIYGISAIMGVAGVLFVRKLFVEMTGLFFASILYTYIATKKFNSIDKHDDSKKEDSNNEHNF